MNMSSVSDTEILHEYVRRFSIPAGESIRTSREAADHFRGYFADAVKKEKFVICFLNSQHEILSTEVMFEGTLDTSAVYPRIVVERVIELGAGSLMLAHNHPSGSTTPSGSDRAVTKKLVSALGAIDVDVLDHIIIGNGTEETFSFSDHHLL
jgi:DNA repair protein RadC